MTRTSKQVLSECSDSDLLIIWDSLYKVGYDPHDRGPYCDTETMDDWVSFVYSEIDGRGLTARGLER